MSERVEQLLRTGNEASGRVRNLWITFLLFGTYLAIAIGGTTHQQMLLETPIVLPILNAGLPLVQFYQIAPGLFLVFHFYMLVQLYLLSTKLRQFNSALVQPAVPLAAVEDLRTRTDNFLITQMLVGRKHAPLVRAFVWLAAWLTMVAAPLVLFLAFQIRFLPYHDVLTTWIHRAFLILDVLLLWVVWPAVSSDKGRLGGAARALFWERPIALFQSFRRHHDRATEAYEAGRYWGYLRNTAVGHLVLQREWFALLGSFVMAALIGVGSVGLIGFSVFVATIPAEEVERWLLDHPLAEEKVGQTGKSRWWLISPSLSTLQDREYVPELGRWKSQISPPSLFSLETFSSKRPRWRQAHVPAEPSFVWWPTAILFEGEPDQVTSKVTSLFSRNLVLIDDTDLVTLDDAELKKVERTLVLRGRDLRYARFDRADMRKADFFGAILIEASLIGTRISGASLQYAKLHGASLCGAEMVQTNFTSAEMHGVGLDGAIIMDTKFENAEMQGAIAGQAGRLFSIEQQKQLADYRPRSEQATKDPNAERIAKDIDGDQHDLGTAPYPASGGDQKKLTELACRPGPE